MAKQSLAVEALKGFLHGVAENVQHAAVEIGDTYRAIHMQDTGWSIQSRISAMTHDRAQEIAHHMIEERNRPGLEAEREM